MIHECNGVDHRLESYAARDRRLLALVESFNRRLVASLQQGADLSKVLAALDPDPARYTWVDEGGGLVEAVLEEAESELAAAPRLPGFRSVTSSVLHATLPAARPALATAPDGSGLVAWIEWEQHAGERVVGLPVDASGSATGEPCAVSGPLGDCLRPSVAFDGDGTGWIFFGLRRDDEVGVWCSRLSASGFSEAELVSTTPHPSFNQEVVRHDDGSLECCWQGYRDGRFGIFARRQRKGGFGETRLISSESDRNVWDPAIAADGKGTVAHAWTTYGEQGYQTSLLVRRKGEAPHRQTLRAPARTRSIRASPSTGTARSGARTTQWRSAVTEDRDPRGFVRGRRWSCPAGRGPARMGEPFRATSRRTSGPRSSWCASPAPKAMPRAREPSAQARSSRRPACRVSPRPRTDRSPSPTGA